MPAPTPILLYDFDPGDSQTRVDTLLRLLPDWPVQTFDRRAELYDTILEQARYDPALVLVDLARDDSDLLLDGWLVVHTLASHPSLRARSQGIVLSAKGSDEIVVQARAWGAIGFVAWEWLRTATPSMAVELVDELENSEFVTRPREGFVDTERRARITRRFESFFPGVSFDYDRHMPVLWEVARGRPGKAIETNAHRPARSLIAALLKAATDAGAVAVGEGDGALRPYATRFLVEARLAPDRVTLKDLPTPWALRRRLGIGGDCIGDELRGTIDRARLTDDERHALIAFLQALPLEKPNEIKRDQGRLSSYDQRLSAMVRARDVAYAELGGEQKLRRDLETFGSDVIRAALKLQATNRDEVEAA